MADYSAGRLVKRKQRDGSYQWQARIERHGADGSSKTLSKSTGIECDPPSSKDRRGVPSGKGAKSAAEALTMLAWQSIPGHLSQENKKFIFGQVRKGARASDLEESLAWLQQAGLLYKVSRASKPHVPLKAYCNMNAFKVFVVDVGSLAP